MNYLEVCHCTDIECPMSKNVEAGSNKLFQELRCHKATTCVNRKLQLTDFFVNILYNKIEYCILMLYLTITKTPYQKWQVVLNQVHQVSPKNARVNNRKDCFVLFFYGDGWEMNPNHTGTRLQTRINTMPSGYYC